MDDSCLNHDDDDDDVGEFVSSVDDDESLENPDAVGSRDGKQLSWRRCTWSSVGGVCVGGGGGGGAAAR